MRIWKEGDVEARAKLVVRLFDRDCVFIRQVRDRLVLSPITRSKRYVEATVRKKLREVPKYCNTLGRILLERKGLRTEKRCGDCRSKPNGNPGRPAW